MTVMLARKRWIDPSSRHQASRPRHTPSSSIKQIDGEILDEEARLVLEALLVERVQDRMAGAVGGGAGTKRHIAFGVSVV